MMNNYIRVRILRISSLSLVAVLFLWESLRGVSQSNLACQFTPTLWSWILFQSTSSISCVDNFLYCFHILLLATPLQSSKRNTIVFYEYKSDSTAEQNKQQNKWCLWKSKQHAFSTINSMPGRFELPFAPVETHGTGSISADLLQSSISHSHPDLIQLKEQFLL